jgi:uncharacterized protein
VRRTAIQIAYELQLDRPQLKLDLFVIELAALFHDILDKKYLVEPVMEPVTYFRPFFGSVSRHVDLIGDGRAELILRIVENVSWTSEKMLRATEGGWTEWHENCLELHCVQDADRLDAIGGIGITSRSSCNWTFAKSASLGILRCAAYSAISKR